jgi:transposase
MDTKPKTHLSHEQRRERRQLIAAAVSGGMSIEEAAGSFGVTADHVVRACKSEGVAYKRKDRRVSPKTLQIVGALMAGKPTTEIREWAGVSRAYLHQLRIACREAGIPLPDTAP